MGPSPAPVSMLGKLFSIGSGASGNDQDPIMAHPSKPVACLDSVQEDIHTRSLLFPDTHSLYLHRNDQVFPLSSTPSLPVASMTNAFDYTGELDLEARDVRVLIMQDALGSSNASLLFDSHPCPAAPVPPSPAVTDPRRTPTSPRKSSIGQASRPLIIQPDNPHLRQGAFDRRGEYQSRTHSFAETDGQRATREYREELATFTSCIFGSSELMAYKGTSTKVHVVPTEPRFTDYSTSSITDGRGSIGRASMRSSKLAQSYSSELVSPTHAPASFATSQLSYRPPDRKKILITRLFPVVVPSDDETTAYQGQAVDESAHPDDSASQKRRLPQPRQKRTPMYAVVLVVQLPTLPSAPKLMFRGASSLTDQESYPSSYNSTRRSGWTMVGSGNDSLDSSLPFDGEDPMDSITQHWDIIMRTLTHLQSVTASTLGTLLKQVDQGPSGPSPIIPQNVAKKPSLSSRRPEDQQHPKAPKTNAKLIALPPNALSQDQHILQHTQVARVRIVTGLKAARVVTGQGRWGIWRDEARLAYRTVGPLDQHFLLTALTGFLATHTDWLQALSPACCRKKFLQQQRTGGEEDLSVSSRTIIVSEDKMAARRFVFLLSAFLPAHQSVPTVRPHRPSTSTSYGPLSQSPPSVIVPIVREESLRRKMTRRSGPRRTSHSRTVSQSTRASIPTQLAHLSIEGQNHHERRGSDAASIRTTNLSMPYGDFGSKKSVAATTTTTSPDSTVPHFSTVHRTDSRRSTRPGSSSSFAADDLRRSLQRGDSMGQSSTTSNESRNQGSKWGSVISGLWSGTRRRDSTNAPSEGFRPPVSPGFDLPSPSKPSQSSIDRSSRSRSVAEMAHELSLPDPNLDGHQQLREDGPETPRGLRHDHVEGVESTSQSRRWPEPGASFESRVKTTVNREDGVVDVDVPFPDFLTNPHSFDTAVSSPSSSGYLSTPGLGTVMDTFEQACRLALEGDMPLNSAGWLQAYHPDFILQAIPPQRDLINEVKASLKAEPSPLIIRASPDDSSNKWVDISTAVIADMTTGKVMRIRYRRLIKPKQTAEKPSSTHTRTAGVYSGAPLTPSILPYETTLEEEFIEDEITTVDEALAYAVERVAAHVGDASKATSSNSSRSNSKARRVDGRGGPSRSPPPEEAINDDAPRTPTVSHEVPRNECRTVILSALADLIQDVLDRRNAGTPDDMPEGQSAIRSAIKGWLNGLDLTSD
ncbi:hypothetical protein jhhlp_005905 [Lomentospora prolificans]|uniref:Folliculin-interacting protein N-terminal domain-containing protein n=1 Tax=Lomentospora prolificans TaxID=41688 RepID=A0A2N3N4E6_9PEZI|nr:hypothetical protein jhhlp_005905 [Lomentospora prolificans]